MRVLLDECVDPKVRQFFSDRFEVLHVKDVGWLGIKNGELVKRANESFEVLFTIDSNMRYQTSLKSLALVVAVAEGHFRSVDDYKEPIRRFEELVQELVKGSFHLLSAASPPS